MIRSFRLAALAAFAGLAFVAAPSADAAYSYSTTVQSVTANGVQTNLGNNPNASYTVSGVTINFTNESASNLNSVTFASSIGVSLSGTYTPTTSPTEPITVVSLITINNNGAVATFTQTTSYSLYNASPTAPSGQFVLVSNGSSIVPTQATFGGNNFRTLTANATTADFGFPTVTNGTITASFLVSTAAIPEPASVVMLGLGLVGTAGVAARRRLARA